MVEFRERVLGAAHSSTARSKKNLAATYNALGQHQDVLKLQLEAVEFSERVHGAKYLDTAASKNNLAVTYGALGQHQDALKQRLEVVEFSERVRGGRASIHCCQQGQPGGNVRRTWTAP